MQIDKLRNLFDTELSRKRLLALFILLLATVGIWNAFRFGGAALDYYFVRNAIELWQNDANLQTNEKYLAAKQAIDSAESKHFSHPLYADLSGQLEEWGFMAGYKSVEALQNAKYDYLRATKLRPSWPVTWGSLAVIKWRLQEFDDEMLSYLNKADEMGPQKPEIHVLFTELGLALYVSNHPFYVNVREQTQHRLIAGLRNRESRQRVKQAIISYDALELSCIWSKRDDELVYNDILNCKALQN
ncbi:VpsP family polysaccharide biosynthesis protein [Glaciecola sp. SC05]|uniref:VpsP family polysaccharide biosynthesis protein n=1 Tax=Glaciecola sp. SC05 TaxID=1987355 RepID=UPI00352734AF